MFGQASTREYYRAHLPEIVDPPEPLIAQTSPLSTAVVMHMPSGFAGPSDEISKDRPQGLPYLSIQRYLCDIGIRVPLIYGIDESAGLILLEDLGDTMFEQLALKSTDEFKIFYYRKALELLVDMQMKTAIQKKDCICWKRKFDSDLLNWEFDHFLEYGIEDRFQMKVSPEDKKYFHDTTRSITDTLLSTPSGFTHRDFQSRNIMFHQYQLVLIDFQDALVGPVIYDLVALLRDSYISFSPQERDHLLLEYCKLLPSSHPYFGRQKELIRDFHLMTLQRKLKDTGRFQYILTVRKNPDFLKHVPLSLQYVKEAFVALPEFSKLHQTLARYVPELA